MPALAVCSFGCCFFGQWGKTAIHLSHQLLVIEKNSCQMKEWPLGLGGGSSGSVWIDAREDDRARSLSLSGETQELLPFSPLSGRQGELGEGAQLAKWMRAARVTAALMNIKLPNFIFATFVLYYTRSFYWTLRVVLQACSALSE